MLQSGYKLLGTGQVLADMDVGPEVEWTPKHIVASAWLEHIPFAFWLTKTLKPRKFVELGADRGASYAAFCQAVSNLEIEASCFAVDTWMGDIHAGYYGEDVFSDVFNMNNEYYRHFSSLMRMTFSDAVAYFSDGEIDLLHIDGLHTYDAVKDDFETWRSKLSDRAVVLFHDTTVRERDFGVWKLWQELVADYPSFEFIHGHGLGVLGVGTNLPAQLRSLFEAGGEREQNLFIRNFFASRGAAVQNLYDRDQALAIAAKQTAEAKSLKTLLTQVEAQRNRLEITVSDRNLELDSVKDNLSKLNKQFALTQSKHTEASSKMEDELHSARVHILRLEEKLAHVDSERQALLSSTSWRVTAPLRLVGRLSKQVRGRGPASESWTALQAGRAYRFGRLTSVLSKEAGGPLKLMGAGFKVLRHKGFSGIRDKLRAHELRVSYSAGTPSGRHIDPVQIARDIFAEQQAELTAEQARLLQHEFTVRPLISVIMPVYKTPVKWLRRAVESLQEQYYDNWELCAIDDCSPTDEQRNLLRELAAVDSRVRYKVMERNGGISAASNTGLEMARGDYIALLDHDDEITRDALFRIVEAINKDPDLDFVYSDECKIDDTEERQLFHFIFKPDWSPEILFNGMVTGHLTAYRKSLVLSVGGFRSAYDFSQDYDLALRASEVAKSIVHLERVLYLWRAIPGSAASGDKDFARETNIAALDDALRRRGIPGTAIALPSANYVSIDDSVLTAKVSIIIPSDSLENLRLALEAIRNTTVYPDFEIIVVCNGSLADKLTVEFSHWKRVRFVKYDKPYNFSDKCNEGAHAATGDIVIFYNDDVFPLKNDWLKRLVEYLYIPGVGGASPKLLYENGAIQYAGMISGTPGLCGTAFNHIHGEANDPFLTMHKMVRNVTILSGACCALWKDKFFGIGGFDAVNTPDAHSDMCLSYKLLDAGLRCVYTPYSLLTHIGNHSWGNKPYKQKADIFALKRWGRHVETDPYFTDTMKRVLYRDFTFNYKIHAGRIDQDASYSGPDVLFVSHELSLTGAPRMLFYAACLVRRQGGFPVVVCPNDGPLRQELEDAGVTVIIDASVNQNHFLFERFARNFDLAIVNSCELGQVVAQLSRIPIIRTIWWLHEGELLSRRHEAMAAVQWEQVQAVCVSDYAKGFMPEGIDVKVLANGIPDQSRAEETAKIDHPLTFVLSGTLEARKGQDIFVEAISLLPQNVRKQCRFYLTGKLWDINQTFWQVVQSRMRSMPEIEYLGSFDHQSQIDLLLQSDIVVCCSRDEAFSLVAAEAAMLSRPVILNERVGISSLFNDRSSLKFEAGNAVSLAEKLLEAFAKRDSLADMNASARCVYETELSLEKFSKRFLELMNDQIEANPTTSRF